MFNDVMNYLRDLNLISILFRMILSIICGGIIGLEREDKNRPAGLRTHVLVCIGAATVMMTSQYMVNNLGGTDLSRMGAQVISGIGFLGAGTILISRGHVRGLTTAAGLWAVACVGLAVGIGFYEGALAELFSFLRQWSFFTGFSHKFQNASKCLDVYVEIDKTKSINDIMNFFDLKDIGITRVEYCEKPHYNPGAKGFMFSLEMNKRKSHTQVIDEIGKMNGVYFIEQI